MKRVSAAEATEHWLRTTKGPLDDCYQEERWYRSRLPSAELRTAQAEYRGWPLTKHARMALLLERNRQAVIDRRFPEAREIIDGFDAPAIIVLMDREGRLHVTDGLKRTFMTLWQGRRDMDAYIFHEQSDRPLPTDDF